MGRVRFSAAILAAVCALASTAASAAQRVSLHVAFSPNRLGQSTTILMHVEIGGVDTPVPSPVAGIDMSLPPGMGLGMTELGLASCDPARLIKQGPKGCPPNSYLGFGKAVAEIPFGPVVVHEPVRIAIFMAPARHQHTALLLYVAGDTPVSAQLVFPALLLQGPTPGEVGHLNTVIPPTPALPGAPDASVVDIHISFGPRGLVYYKRVRGKYVGYHPMGMAVPPACPHGGFRFAAVFRFQDGSRAEAMAEVACPRIGNTRFSHATTSAAHQPQRLSTGIRPTI
jgi:hypothetical protein